jgi:putative SOS response-associated peptidase YedK
MCGRFTLIFDSEFFRRFVIQSQKDGISPRYNIAPTQEVPIIVNEEGNKVVMMTFGLIPSWSKEKKTRYSLINARSETVAKKPMFRRLLRKYRCLVPTTGFYEWKKIGSRKVPYFIRLKDEKYFALAGLWDHWKGPEKEEIRSFTIITTKANDVLNEIHPRMPVILRKDDEGLWLSDKVLTGKDLERLFRSFPSELMVSYPVSSSVNSVSNDAEELVAPA